MSRRTHTLARHLLVQHLQLVLVFVPVSSLLHSCIERLRRLACAPHQNSAPLLSALSCLQVPQIQASASASASASALSPVRSCAAYRVMSVAAGCVLLVSRRCAGVAACGSAQSLRRASDRLRKCVHFPVRSSLSSRTLPVGRGAAAALRIRIRRSPLSTIILPDVLLCYATLFSTHSAASRRVADRVPERFGTFVLSVSSLT